MGARREEEEEAGRKREGEGDVAGQVLKKRKGETRRAEPWACGRVAYAFFFLGFSPSPRSAPRVILTDGSVDG